MKMKLGLQLMLGLPCDNNKRFNQTVSDAINMNPDFVRLYPALVMRHTSLHSMYLKGLYEPWTLSQTIKVLKGAIKSFEINEIPVVRVGLQPDKSLEDNLVAGPFHPALRYLIDCQLAFDLMESKINSLNHIPKKISFKVPRKTISIYTGNRRENIRLLKKKFSLDEVSFYSNDLCENLELIA